jgi:hypothetical protein
LLNVGAAASATTTPSGCVVRLTRFAFRPSTAPEGSRVVLGLSLVNCTGKTETLRLTQFGTQPPGCPVIDPLTKTIAVKAHQTYRAHTVMTAPPCAGTEQITLQVSRENGKQLASATADLTVTARS